MVIIGICDDDEKSRKKLKTFCERFFPAEDEILEYASGKDFWHEMKSETDGKKVPDILLLDIEMEDLNGLEIKRKLIQADAGTRILFVTNHEELMAEAYGKNVFGFLTKPLRYERFEEKMQEMQEDIERGRRNIEIVLNPYERKKLRLAQILYLKAAKPYTEVWFLEKGTVKKLLDGRGIQTWKEELSHSDFFMLDKSCLVNLGHVQKVWGEEVLMDDGTMLTVSRRRRSEFWRVYKKYVDEQAR